VGSPLEFSGVFQAFSGLSQALSSTKKLQAICLHSECVMVACYSHSHSLTNFTQKRKRNHHRYFLLSFYISSGLRSPPLSNCGLFPFCSLLLSSPQLHVPFSLSTSLEPHPVHDPSFTSNFTSSQPRRFSTSVFLIVTRTSGSSQSHLRYALC
jgi:hypothetical protein